MHIPWVGNWVRGSAKLLMVLVGVSSVALSSCDRGLGPGLRDIDKTNVSFIKQVERIYQEMLRGCENRIDRDACRADALDWRQKTLEKLGDLNSAWHNQHIQEAMRLREEWNKALRDAMPKFPDIADLFKVLIVDGTMSLNITGTTTDPPLFTQQPSDEIVAESQLPLQTDAYTFSGSAGLQSERLTTSASVDGSLSISRQVDHQGRVTYHVDSGYLRFTAEDHSVGTFTVVSDSTNLIDLDGSGAGWVTILTIVDYTDSVWASLLPYYYRTRLPMALQTDGSLLIDTAGWVPTDAYVPYVPWAASDYDLNGILEYNSDFAAFMADFNARDLRADLTVDEQWTQDDIDFWTIHFDEDLSHQQ